MSGWTGCGPASLYPPHLARRGPIFTSSRLQNSWRRAIFRSAQSLPHLNATRHSLVKCGTWSEDTGSEQSRRRALCAPSPDNAAKALSLCQQCHLTATSVVSGIHVSQHTGEQGALKGDLWYSLLVQLFPYCAILGGSFTFFKPRCSHLKNWHKNSTHLKGQWWGLNRLTFIK